MRYKFLTKQEIRILLNDGFVVEEIHKFDDRLAETHDTHWWDYDETKMMRKTRRDFVMAKLAEAKRRDISVTKTREYLKNYFRRINGGWEYFRAEIEGISPDWKHISKPDVDFKTALARRKKNLNAKLAAKATIRKEMASIRIPQRPHTNYQELRANRTIIRNEKLV